MVDRHAVSSMQQQQQQIVNTMLKSYCCPTKRKIALLQDMNNALYAQTSDSNELRYTSAKQDSSLLLSNRSRKQLYSLQQHSPYLAQSSLGLNDSAMQCDLHTELQ